MSDKVHMLVSIQQPSSIIHHPSSSAARPPARAINDGMVRSGVASWMHNLMLLEVCCHLADSA